jgi:sugar lactone lactonase YvrE
VGRRGEDRPVILRLAVAAGLLAALTAAPASAATCPTWTDRTVASGFGSLENLEFDEHGGLFLSASTQNAIVRLTPDGKSTTAVADVTSPGGQRLVGGKLFFNTGDSAASGTGNRADGTLDTFDPATGKRATLATGLTMPNGLAVLPNGDFVTSRDLGSGTGITRVPKADPAHPQINWAKLDDTNGMAVDPSGRYLYVDSTFTTDQQIRRVDISDPAKVTVIAQLMSLSTPTIPAGLDDMTIDADGLLYVAANLAGKVARVDPADGSVCVIASGLKFTSSLKFGRGPGWEPTALYVTGFDGVVHELTPPKDAVPTLGKLALKAAPQSVTARAKARKVTFTATAAGLPIAGASVSFAGARGTTDARGRTTVKVKLKRAGKRTAAVTRSGFKGARATIRVR